MKALVITPKSQSEFKFLSDLLKKLDITSTTMKEEEIEDFGLAKMLKSVDKTKKVSRDSIMNKLISQVESSENLTEIQNLKKLAGFAQSLCYQYVVVHRFLKF